MKEIGRRTPYIDIKINQEPPASKWVHYILGRNGIDLSAASAMTVKDLREEEEKLQKILMRIMSPYLRSVARYIGWQSVKLGNNDWEIKGSGFEGYAAAEVEPSNLEGMVRLQAQWGNEMWQSARKQIGPGKDQKIEQALKGKLSEMEIIRELMTAFAMQIARLKASTLGKKPTKETRARAINSLPMPAVIEYQLEIGSNGIAHVTENYRLGLIPQPQRDLEEVAKIMGLDEEAMRGIFVVSNIGIFGHPLVRAIARGNLN